MVDMQKIIGREVTKISRRVIEGTNHFRSRPGPEMHQRANEIEEGDGVESREGCLRFSGCQNSVSRILLARAFRRLGGIIRFRRYVGCFGLGWRAARMVLRNRYFNCLRDCNWGFRRIRKGAATETLPKKGSDCETGSQQDACHHPRLHSLKGYLTQEALLERNSRIEKS
jgi:hypothetical protein